MRFQATQDELYEDSMRQALLELDGGLKKLAQEFGIDENELADLRSEFVENPDAVNPDVYDPTLTDKVKQMISEYLDNPEEPSAENLPAVDDFADDNIEEQPGEFDIWDME